MQLLTNSSINVQKYKSMKKIFIGIDFSKEKFDAAIIFADGSANAAPITSSEFSNKAAGYKQFIKWVKANASNCDETMWLFCGENTGDYSKCLCIFLYGKGYDMWLENAKCIKDTAGMRRQKSDRADAAMIAEYAMRFHDKAVLYEPLSKSLMQLRELFLYRQSLVREKRSVEVRWGEKKLVMEKCPTRTKISQSSKRVTNMFEIEITRVNKLIDELIESDDELKEVYTIITSVPGVGTQNAVCMMVYTNNFHKFNFDSRKIACFCGIAPFGRDSGTSVHTDPHVHFMANRQMKAILTQAALSAARFNPRIKMYYEHLLERGKKKQVALNAVKNKLIHIVTAMVRDRRTFDSNYGISA
jgi:transposase